MAKTCSNRGPKILSGVKRQDLEQAESERPTKRLKGLLEQDDTPNEEDSVSSNDMGVFVRTDESETDGHGFKVNHEFARRFEHNKKREELHKLQEKYGSNVSTGARRRPEPNEDNDDSTGSSTDSEEEDDEGVLASEALDQQIQDTLEAIRKKDPRVYDEKAKFFTDLDDDAENSTGHKMKSEKPMYLSDYHRRNLLEGAASTDIQDEGPITYAQQQNDLKNVLVKEMHAVANEEKDSGDDENNDGFLVRKPSALPKDSPITRSKEMVPKLDVEAADKDPETFLSNFMSARAWVPAAGTTFQPFESEDEEEDRRAELFEEAYNLRFEKPQGSNEKLLSHARDAAVKYSVRKESSNPRKKAREAEQAKKEAARQARDEEKARYRRLKVAEVEEKISKIKDAAGLRGKSLQEQDWSAFLDEAWDDDRWEKEMRKRFGNDYYADQDSDAGNEGEGKRKRKIKKPKWEDDIDIADLVPEFDAAEQEKLQFSLTDNESTAGEAPVKSNDGTQSESDEKSKSKPKPNKKHERDEHKKEARLERRKIEQLVDESMNVDETLSNFSKKHAGHFSYRETSPIAYGLTPHDILMASDSQLNQYAGLKKMAAFRDSDKKRKDKKRLGKKARLRQWRKETFGSEQGPQKTLAEMLAGQDLADHKPKLKGTNGIDIRQGKKKTRSRKSKPSSR
ncbi:MAG: KRRI-Interacting protein 1 [Alectoria fallacina]|uniref:KRRI-Interacting protein 1 n=1 Tax=Alectoria fallacina TaxID=1903189 RepID=A0A8H3EE29_9LECA|nr:MAG: KRRI-Interacting protein 1 [Alectoria fallacina]